METNFYKLTHPEYLYQIRAEHVNGRVLCVKVKGYISKIVKTFAEHGFVVNRIVTLGKAE